MLYRLSSDPDVPEEKPRLDPWATIRWIPGWLYPPGAPPVGSREQVERPGSSSAKTVHPGNQLGFQVVQRLPSADSAAGLLDLLELDLVLLVAVPLAGLETLPKQRAGEVPAGDPRIVH